MKFIVIGLGSFGSTIAEKLTQQGNEVIGIDSNLEKVNSLKEKISHTICINVINEETVSELPIETTDAVIICIGADQGANVMVTALFKNIGVKRLISRATNHLHENVLKAIGVDDIIRPEEEAAGKWARKLCLTGMVDSFKLNKDYSIVEVKTPESLVGKSVESVAFRKDHKIIILTILKQKNQRSVFGKEKMVTSMQGIPQLDTVLSEGDILVLYGENKDLDRFIQSKEE